jgi:hypothetical protein
MILSIVGALFVVWLIDRSYSLLWHYLDYRRLKLEGVVFINNSFNPIGDMKLMLTCLEKYPTSVSFAKQMREELGNCEILPPVVGRVYLGKINLMFTNVDQL